MYRDINENNSNNDNKREEASEIKKRDNADYRYVTVNITT